MPYEFASFLQKTVDDTIRQLGGYWPPLAAVARILEELGEVSEELVKTTSTQPHDDLVEEVADLVIITTCLANQYCVDLDHEIRLASADDIKECTALPPHSRLLRAFAVGGAIARTVNMLEGDKPIREGHSAERIGPLIARFHQLLYGFDDKVPEATHTKLSRSIIRDSGRFSPKFDPIHAPSLERFVRIQQGTHCLFAPIARVWGAPQWDNTVGFGPNLLRAIPVLTRFVRVANSEFLDGFLLEFIGDYGATIDRLAATVNSCLRFLASQDPTGYNCMNEQIDHTSWQFQFNRVRCFVISFAPCYPETSSRYAFGAENTYMFLQPEKSFDHLKIARGEDKQVRTRIRRAFADHGRGYEGDIVNTPLEAPRYVKPLRLGDPPVRWWETSEMLS